jgi:Holliday junction DNA helicase RuvA
MIAYLKGTLLKQEMERIILLASGVGYEVILPAVVMGSLGDKKTGDDLSLYIYYHQTERQPKPVLIGFTNEVEKDFFQAFLSVEAIGPLKAVKALDIPIGKIAAAIENGDLGLLKSLKGIGARTAQKIIASLQGKVDRFVTLGDAQTERIKFSEEMIKQVLDVLVLQLGHRSTEGRRMISDALKRNSAINTPEQLFDEIYRGEGL